MVTENLLKRPRRFASSQVRGSSDPRGVAKVSTRTKPTGNLMAAQLYRRCLSANLKTPGFAPLTFTSNALRVDFVTREVVRVSQRTGKHLPTDLSA